jgi:hypothetical protein
MTTVAAPAGLRAVALTLAVPCVARFMLIVDVVDVVDVNVALPSIRETLEVSGARLQLVAARAAQGVGATMVPPTARPPRHRRVGTCEWTRH